MNKELWHEQVDLTPVVMVNLATQYNAMYSLTYNLRAQVALLKWVQDSNPDAEDFFTALNTIEHTHLDRGFSRWNLHDVVEHRPDLQKENPDYFRLQSAYLTYVTQSWNGLRTFGDAKTFTRSDVVNAEGQHKGDRCQSLAYSNGCPDINNAIRKTSEKASSPSSSLLHKELNELELREHWMDVTISDYFRQNTLWNHVMGIVQNSGNATLLRNILHAREELPDAAGDTKWMPKKINGTRQVRFLALEKAFFGIVKPIWGRFDTLCANEDYEGASKAFDDDIKRLATIITDPSFISLDAVVDAFGVR